MFTTVNGLMPKGAATAGAENWFMSKFFKAKLFLPLINNWSFKCCGGCKYLHFGFSLVHRPYNIDNTLLLL